MSAVVHDLKQGKFLFIVQLTVSTNPEHLIDA